MNQSIEQINKEKAKKGLENLMNLTIEDLDVANDYSEEIYKKLGYGGFKGYGAEPPEVELNKLAQAVYKGRNDIPGYELLESIPTIGVYKKIADNTLVIAVRGSADTQDWITNAQLPFNNLTNTQRYKTDKEYVMNAIAKYGQGNDIYITAHSLGGVIADQLKKDFEQIKSGTSFNPAFQAKDLLNSDESKVKRKYTAEDPLGIVGRFLKGAEVEAPKKNETSLFQKGLNYLSPVSSAYDFLGRKLKGHKLTEFESREGGKISEEPGDPIIPEESIMDILLSLIEHLPVESSALLFNIFGEDFDKLDDLKIVVKNLPKLTNDLFNNSLETPYSVKLLDLIYDLYITSYIGSVVEIKKNKYDGITLSNINKLKEKIGDLKHIIIQKIRKNSTESPNQPNNIPSFDSIIRWVNKESIVSGAGKKRTKKTLVY